MFGRFDGASFRLDSCKVPAKRQLDLRKLPAKRPRCLTQECRETVTVGRHRKGLSMSSRAEVTTRYAGADVNATKKQMGHCRPREAAAGTGPHCATAAAQAKRR